MLGSWPGRHRTTTFSGVGQDTNGTIMFLMLERSGRLCCFKSPCFHTAYLMDYIVGIDNRVPMGPHAG